MYRFLRRPRWIAFTLAIVAVMALMLAAARWQWHRHQDRQDRNEVIDARRSEPPVPVESVLGLSGFDADRDEWRAVQATGTYLADGQVTIANRSYQGQGGEHVVTPLLLDNGQVLLVNRGWIAPTAPAPAPPPGTIEILGRLRPSQTRGSFGPADPNEGVLTRLARVDVQRIAQQLDAPVLDAYVELVGATPAPDADDPALVLAPEPGSGPHLSYAAQWLIFTACAAVGWGIVVRRTARQSIGAAGTEPLPDRLAEP